MTSGRILVDGVDLREYSLRTLRSCMAIVQQESFSFTGTVRENLVYGRPDAGEEEMLEASRAACVHEFVSRLRGQRQRVSIARALLEQPRILILDEATSALDAESEGIVQEALERLMQNRTRFIVAHRPSTVRNANRIMALDRGRVVETGRHDELISQNGGAYQRLVRRQSGV